MGNTSKRVPLFCAASLACSLAFAGAGCAEGGAVSADSPVVADGVTTSEPFLSPMSSREVLLDEVTKPTDTEALEAAYGELLDILEVDESPGMWERLDAEEGGGRA